jgi:hypothetical protein
MSMKPTYMCPRCLRALPDDCMECWECGIPAVLKKTQSATSTPGPRTPPVSWPPVSTTTSTTGSCTSTSSSGGSAPRASAVSALVSLVPVALLIGALMYWSPVRLGKLTIHSEPAGAAVHVGNQVLGQTPLQIEGNAGEYWVTLKLEKHEAVAAQVRIPFVGNAVAHLPMKKVEMPARPKSTKRKLAGAKTAAVRALQPMPAERI